MVIDIGLLVVVFVWAVFGYRKGFMHQLIGLLALVCVVLFSTTLAQIAERILADEVGISMAGARMRILLTSTCAAIIYITISLVGAFLHQTLVKGIKPAEKTDRVLGMTLGILTSAIAIYVVMCALVLAREKIDKYLPEAGGSLDQSVVYQTAYDYNIVTASPFDLSLPGLNPTTEPPNAKDADIPPVAPTPTNPTANPNGEKLEPKFAKP